MKGRLLAVHLYRRRILGGQDRMTQVGGNYDMTK